MYQWLACEFWECLQFPEPGSVNDFVFSIPGMPVTSVLIGMCQAIRVQCTAKLNQAAQTTLYSQNCVHSADVWILNTFTSIYLRIKVTHTEVDCDNTHTEHGDTVLARMLPLPIHLSVPFLSWRARAMSSTSMSWHPACSPVPPDISQKTVTKHTAFPQRKTWLCFLNPQPA